MLEFKELMTVFQVVIVILSYGIEQGNIVSVFHQRGWIFYHNLQGRIGFNTVNHPLSTGKDFPIHSVGKES